MKHLMIPLLLAGSLIALSTMEAGAVVCARGVVRAGCVAAGGAAVVTTAPVVTAPVVRPQAELTTACCRYGHPREKVCSENTLGCLTRFRRIGR
jgi:hypothetical protein